MIFFFNFFFKVLPVLIKEEHKLRNTCPDSSKQIMVKWFVENRNIEYIQFCFSAGMSILWNRRLKIQYLEEVSLELLRKDSSTLSLF